MSVRFLHLADTHLGLDLPMRQRTPGWRRGHDILEAYDRALDLAREQEVDMVIHAGDLFNRSRPPMPVVERGAAALRALADEGIEVVVVPGNHERSQLPGPLLFAHPGIHQLTSPRTVVLERNGLRVAVAGFPFRRHDSTSAFPALLAETRWDEVDADVRLLAVHQMFDGSVVGPSGFTFRAGPDVIPLRLVPTKFDYVAAGHVHPHQVLKHPVDGGPAIVYAGSTERMSTMEAGETKGAVLGEAIRDGVTWRFEPLPTRPFHVIRATVRDHGDVVDLEQRVQELMDEADPEGMAHLSIIDPLHLCDGQISRWRKYGRRFKLFTLRHRREPGRSG